MSHFAYVIADNEKEADSKVRGWILSNPGDRRIREGWDICFKGHHDALALLEKHKPYEPNAQMWSVALAFEVAYVPRETSSGDCPDCQVSPGEPHSSGCDRARCTICGEQRITCKHGDGDEGWHEIYVPRETKDDHE